DQRKFVTEAKKLGFTFQGQSNSSHLSFINADGIRYTSALTPSCPHAWKNALRDMEKISGRALPRQKSGKHRFKKAQHLDLRRSPAEVHDSAIIDGLMARAESLRSEFKAIVANPDTSH